MKTNRIFRWLDLVLYRVYSL